MFLVIRQGAGLRSLKGLPTVDTHFVVFDALNGLSTVNRETNLVSKSMSARGSSLMRSHLGRVVSMKLITRTVNIWVLTLGYT